MIVLIRLTRDHNKIVNSFLSRIDKEPMVLDSWFVTGEYDLVLRVVAKDMEQYDSFSQEVFHKDESVQHFKTLVTMRHSKVSGPVPVSY